MTITEKLLALTGRGQQNAAQNSGSEKPEDKPEDKREESPEEKPEDKPEEKVDAAAGAKAEKDRAAGIATLCAERGCPQLAAGLIASGATLEEAKARTVNAEAIRGAFGLATKFNPAIDPKGAEAFIASGASLEHVKASLFEKLVAAQSPAINNSHSPDSRSSGGAANNGWDASIARVSGR